MDDPADENKMVAFKEVVAENNPLTKQLSRLATAAALPMLGLILWMTQTGVTSIIHVLEDHGTKISALVDIKEETLRQVKDFRDETAKARVNTAHALKIIEDETKARLEAIKEENRAVSNQIRTIEARLKEIEQKVKGQ